MQASELETSSDRYIALCLHQALESDALGPSDFIDLFPPKALMEGLEAAPALRARVLVETAGVHAKIAPKKSTAAAAEDLQLALEEGICTAEEVLSLITIENFVRYFELSDLWGMLTKQRFWKNDSDAARDRLLFMLQTALEVELVDVSQLMQAISPEQILTGMPKEDLEHALLQGLILGLEGTAFSPEEFVNTIPLEAWLQYVSADHIWDTAMMGEIAVAAGVASRGPTPGTTNGDKKRRRMARKRDSEGPISQPPISQPPVSQPPISQAPASNNEAENAARLQAIAKLSEKERVPRRVEHLRTPVLLGLESMYADLLSLDTDEERAECIRDAFPNEEMLKEALLALAETLDPRLEEAELRSKGADAAGLVQLVLFEERRIANRAKGISPSSPPPPMKLPVGAPPPPGSGRPPGPPPLPAPSLRASNPPPPLPAQVRRR